MRDGARNDFLLRKIKQLGSKLGYELTNAADPAEIFSILVKHRGSRDASSDKKRAFVEFVLYNLPMSKAQLFQDLFVLFSLEQKKRGFFVEFGAADGIELSNTVLLEKSYEWQGILAEPARCWHGDLKKNRKCTIDTRCVWARSGEVVEFKEVREPELSTINKYSTKDGHSASRGVGEVYQVETVSLNDLLASNGAPSQIDYLSVDTEGSELDILGAFDFAKYDVRIITVEHNFTSDREKIYKLLTPRGFVRVLERFSMWDDWYINRDPAALRGLHD